MTWIPCSGTRSTSSRGAGPLLLLSWGPEPRPTAQSITSAGGESQPRCLGLGGSRTARSSPDQAQDGRGNGLKPRSCPLPGRRPAPLKSQALAKLLLYSQCWDRHGPPPLVLLCPSEGEECYPAHLMPCILSPFSLTLGPKAHFPSQTPEHRSGTCSTPQLGPALGLSLAATTAHLFIQDGQRCRFLGAGQLVSALWC